MGMGSCVGGVSLVREMQRGDFLGENNAQVELAYDDVDWSQ